MSGCRIPLQKLTTSNLMLALFDSSKCVFSGIFAPFLLDQNNHNDLQLWGAKSYVSELL